MNLQKHTMNKSRVLGAIITILTTFVTASANAAFIGRLETSPGSGVFQAYYDDQLDITWTADANINGLDIWGNQVAWAGSLMINGIGGWRLPSMDVNGDDVLVGCSSDQAACKDNEYAHLLGYGAGTVLGSGITPSSPGPFSNVQFGVYWSGTEIPSNPSRAGSIDFNSGSLVDAIKDNTIDFAWAVHSGDVGTVPVPAAVWLFGSGLLGLIGMASRKKATSPLKQYQ